MLEHTPLSSSTCVKDFGICQKVDDEGNLNELSSFPYSCIAYMLLLFFLRKPSGKFKWIGMFISSVLIGIFLFVFNIFFKTKKKCFCFQLAVSPQFHSKDTYIKRQWWVCKYIDILFKWFFPFNQNVFCLSLVISTNGTFQSSNQL